MKTSEITVDISTALSKFQGSLNSVKKDSKGYNYTYANLASVWETIREPMLENGLSVVQDTCTVDGSVAVSTRVMHTSGQWIEFGPLVVPMAKKDAHGTGSATSYGRRYGLCAALGVVSDDEDDDGAEANKTNNCRNTTHVTNSNSDDLVKKFLDKWSGIYGKEAIIGFVKYRAFVLGIKERSIINLYSKSDDGFKKEMDSWLAKNNVGVEDEIK